MITFLCWSVKRKAFVTSGSFLENTSTFVNITLDRMMMRMFLMNNVVGELKSCCVEICKDEAIRVTMLLLITKQASPRMEWGMDCGFEQIPSCPELP